MPATDKDQRPTQIESPPASARLRKTAPSGPRAESPLSDIDTQLMLLVRQGDRAAASTLIHRYFDRVARYLGRVVRRPRVVEDLTQDVFLRVLSSAGEYQPSAKFSTWLYRIATNCAMTYFRRQSGRRSAPLEDEAALADPAASPPERRLDEKELKRAVAAALESLPDRQRIALTLFEYEGFSYEQIAAVLDVSTDSVRSLLLRARAALRGKLSGLV